MSRAWSFSSIKLFETCPKKYYHIHVTKDVVEPSTLALSYGEKVHKAAEEYIRDKKTLPKETEFLLPILDRLITIPGEKHCELPLGVSKQGDEYYSCKTLASNVWWRGIADLVIIQPKIFVVDYKTGENTKYADVRQLDLLASALFIHYPHINYIKTALIYVVAKSFIPRNYTRRDPHQYFPVFEREVDRLNNAVANNHWPPQPNYRCKTCPVRLCDFNRSI